MKNGHTTRQKAPAGRYALLDELRGLDLVSMMLYHACWDMMFLFGIWMDWYAGMPGRLWQQTICWVFILLSGFCVQLGHHTLRRGAQVFGAGALVTAVTLLFMPEDRVIFGVLTLLKERGVLDRFDGGVASCEVHINKPDPRIYQALLDQYGLKASECVFIDDNLANVQAAFTLGFVGIRMKESVGTLIRSLATCNVALR